MDYLNNARVIQPELVNIQHYLHENAEIGFDLPLTVKCVTDNLTEYGLKPKIIGNNSVVATIGKPGKTILLRADMDALPIMEETGLPYASKNGHMHACGHDFHTTILLGAAKLLKQAEDELNGTVKLFFQPAEETIKGCQDALDNGLMEDPKVDAALALHTAGGKKGEADIVVKRGTTQASCDHYRIFIQGKGSHGASPHNAIDPIVTGCHMVLALQNITAREINTQKPVVQTICKFAGGSAVNIIPENVELLGTLRALDAEVRQIAKKRVAEIVDLTARTFNADAKLEWLASAPTVTNDDKMADAVIKYVTETKGITYKESAEIGMGSEDFALIMDLVPGAYISLICVGDEDGRHPNGHGPFIIYDDSRLYIGAAAMAATAAGWLRDARG